MNNFFSDKTLACRSLQKILNPIFASRFMRTILFHQVLNVILMPRSKEKGASLMHRPVSFCLVPENRANVTVTSKVPLYCEVFLETSGVTRAQRI